LNPAEFVLVLASALLHAGWSTAIKGSRDPLLFNLLQGGTTLGIAAIVLPLLDFGEIPASVWGWLAITGLTHTLYIYWMSRAFEYGDLTLVYPIARSTPALLPLVAAPLFHEALTPGGLLGIAVVVAGMWLVYAGTSLSWRSFATPAARYALLTLAATVVYSLADKGAMATLAAGAWSSPVPRAVAYYALLALISSVLFTPMVLFHRSPRQVTESLRRDLLAASIASLVSFVGYGMILKALETAPASYVVAVRQSSVLFAIALGVVRLRERPGRARILGGTATVLGVALIAWLGD
jgi:drug/metabolite transporter (DMT)-like permease